MNSVENNTSQRAVIARHGVVTINPHSKYRVKYLGWCYAETSSGHGCTKLPVNRIVTENTGEEQKMDRIIISITKYGLDVEFLEGIKSEYIYRFDIRYISYCSVNTEIGPRIFAWLYKKPRTRLICHAVLCTNKSQTRNLAMDLYAAFHVAYEEFRHKFPGHDGLPEGSERTVSTQTAPPASTRTRSLEREVRFEEKKLTQRCERNALREFHARSDYYPSPADLGRRRDVTTDSDTTSCLSGFSESREIIRYSSATPNNPERLYVKTDGDDTTSTVEEEGTDPDITGAPKVTVLVDPRLFNHGLGPDNQSDIVSQDGSTVTEVRHVKDRVEIDTDDETSIEGENMYVVSAQVETIHEEGEQPVNEPVIVKETNRKDNLENSNITLITIHTSPDLQKAEIIPLPIPRDSFWMEVDDDDDDDESESDKKTTEEGTSVKESGIELESKSREDAESSQDGDTLKLPEESSKDRVSRYVQNSPKGNVAYDPFAPMLDEELFSDEFIDVQIWQHGKA